MHATTEQIEQRVARLEAAEAIRALKMRYAHLCDSGYPTASLKDLFTPDAIWDGGDAFGRHEGWPQIARFFEEAAPRIDWALHYIVASDVYVAEDRQTAIGSWYLWQPMTLDEQALWLMGRYTDTFVKADGTWVMESLTLDVQAATPIDRGWVIERFAK